MFQDPFEKIALIGFVLAALCIGCGIGGLASVSHYKSKIINRKIRRIGQRY